MKVINKIENHQNIQKSQYKQSVERSIEFNKVLQDIQENKKIKISSHAASRLKQRDIVLSDSDFVNLDSAISKIRDKGGKEALIIYNNIAFITSVKNNTIITAVSSDNLKENIFTNIDSAMIL